MRFITWFAIGIVLLFTYYIIPPLYVLITVLIIIYWSIRLYKKIRWLQTPKGKRIKHNVLKGYLQNNYGVKEGKTIYRKIIDELKPRGYR